MFDRSLRNSSSVARALLICFLVMASSSCAQRAGMSKDDKGLDVSSFFDSSHHWYEINDDDKIITPLPDQKKYPATDITGIADNILL